MHAFSSDSRTPCHVDWNGSSGCAGIVAVIAWMTSSKALGRREKETSTDISGETPAGTNRTKQLRRQTCKTAAEKERSKTSALYTKTLYTTLSPQPMPSRRTSFFPRVLEVILPQLQRPTWPAMHVAPAPTPYPCFLHHGAWPCGPPHLSGRC